ncbi:hypothetical protein [Furfurilactobacillus siliginis]|uniref:Uncharacterized protein n=1 Tax=Furfurilactobacillus siliginis TaxID=348151 RepID=A0A0R2L1J6_9LACO|nr:hypothetical protein [Furfurilactobacillus siliginis]KRN95672.1 hypothetical protein IV55_GL001773 [Furfurilactobacillus siliginis]GEK28065.1 hypothetical protein LSI01_03760 [Furfurilactobacillus siliginis]
MATLTEQDWQDFLNKTPRSIRAISLLKDQWQSVLIDNPLFVSMISVADITFAQRLAEQKVVTNISFPLATYAQRQQFRRNYARYLTPEAATYLQKSGTKVGKS